ncbi:MAG: ArsR family transcriptional regulator [Bacteroidetes bacterium]|nr:MAG: ArsR family transcriptional regulator [Bacteroidota bacterium]
MFSVLIKETPVQRDFNLEDVKLARYYKALAHPARIAIMKLLAHRDTCICNDIVQELPLAQSTVSQHLKELKSAGLIQGNITPPSVKYCINQENWQTAKKLIEKFLQ